MGVVTDGDLRRHMSVDLLSLTVDDILTTGTTMGSIYKLLKANGLTTVIGLALTYTSLKHV